MATSVSLLEKYTQKGDILGTVKDYERSPAADLFRRVIKETAGSKNTIAGFNNWVENILPTQIKAQNFVSDSGVTVTFSDIFLNKPTRVVNNKEIPLYPKFCREYQFPYTGKLELTCTTLKGKDKRVIRINLGNIPIMLGSNKCNLFGKNPEELVELGECITDPFGYFIVSSEWSLVTHDKKRRYIPFLVYNKKDNNSKPYIDNQYSIRDKLKLVMGEDWNNIQLVDPLSRSDEKNKKYFPIFTIFKIISGLEPEKIIDDYVLKFIDKKLHRRAKIALQASVFEYNNISDPVLYIYSIRNEYKLLKEDTKKRFIENISDNLEKEIFVNLNTEENKEIRINKKVLNLSYMLSRYLLYMLGEIEIDNPDSWNNKRFDNAHIHMEQLFYRIFINVLNKCKKKTGKDRSGSEANINFINFGDYLNSKSKDEFKKIFETSFNTSTWGVKNEPSRRENYREQVRRDTPVALWSQLVKNTNNIPTNGAVVEVRFIQPTQRNKHCIMETPEGKQVGIVKYNCITGIFSLYRDDKDIIDMIKKYGKSYDEKVFNILPMVNGFPISNIKEVIYVDQKVKEILIEAKRKQKIPFDTEIYLNKELSTLEIFSDSSRTITPYLIVNPESKNLVIDEINGWNLDYQTLTRNGCIEFLGAREEGDPEIIISCGVENFYAKKREINSSDEENAKILKRNYNYTHCSIDPMQMFSLTTTICPLSNHQLGPRTSFQASMCKQALGYYNINYHLRFKTFKQLYKAERSLTETDTYFLPMMDLFPSGQIANVAFLCDTDNQEDAVVVSEDYINAGNLNYIKYQVVEIIVPTNTKGYTIKHKIPPLKKNEDPYIYRHIQENGLPKMDSLIESGDCILGQVLITADGEENQSHFADLDVRGYVDRILITRERNGSNPLIRIKLRNYNKYQAGDKLALRYAQKGTVGRVAKREELPVVSDGPNKGIVPDILFNPHGFPTRQTAGLMIEGLLNKAAVYDCKRRDISSFRFDVKDLEEAKQVLRDNGLDEYGYENMESSDGIPLKDKVNLVPLTEQVLKHQVKDKFQYRNIGPRDFRTHQPRSGRAKGGGIRAGEMEKDSFVAHGASAVIRERMMKSSDEFKMIVCNNCGVIINYKFCTVCNNSDPVIVLLPYVFKVLIRLLNGVGIDIRLKTEKVDMLKD